MNSQTHLQPNAQTAPQIAPESDCHPANVLSIEDLDQQIVALNFRMVADEYAMLLLIREFDERGGWLKWGSTSCAHWLHWRCDLSLSAAREKVRVAHALNSLPEISRLFESGSLSYFKVRALTRAPGPTCLQKPSAASAGMAP